MIAVADSGPIIHLSWLHRLDLLLTQFDQILVPPAVEYEVLRATDGTRGLRDIRTARDEGRLRLELGMPSQPAQFSPTLGAGETEAILLASELDAWLLTDDNAARAVASGRGLNVMGTLGILLGARQRGDIQAVHPLLLELQREGFWISRELLEVARRADDEPAAGPAS